MRFLTHRFAVPVVAWIVFVLNRLLAAIEVPHEPAAPTSQVLHPCDDPAVPAPLGPADYDWRQLLAQAEVPVRPARRIKSLPVGVERCCRCGAPREYLVSHGTTPHGYRELKCKVCHFHWAPETTRSTPALFCPFCGRALGLHRQRAEFDLYRCRNRRCPGRQVLGQRYRWRRFHWEPGDLETATVPCEAPVRLARVRFGPRVISQAAVYVVALGTSLRQATRALHETFQFRVSPETIRTWLLALAVQLAPLLQRLPLPCSGTVAIDETYVRVHGRWHYLFAALDARGGHVLAVHLSARRNSRAAATIIGQVLRRAGHQPVTLITDAASIYTVAVSYWRGRQPRPHLRHRVVPGLQATSADFPGTRRHKNRVERLFGSFKAHYRRRKSYQTFAGAWAHAILFVFDYNHLKPHEAHGGAPPVPLTSARGRPVTTWQQLLAHLTQLA